MKPDDWKDAAAQAYGGVLLRETGQILLREPTNHFGGYVWTFAKGKPDFGEMPESAALREVLEETGYRAEVVGVLPGVFHSGLSSNVYYVMRPVGEQGVFRWETQSTRWVSFEDAATLIGKTVNIKGRERDLAVLAAAEIWFASGRLMSGGDRSELNKTARPASRADWRVQDMPLESACLPLDFTLTAEEAARVRLGFVPSVMEEKWFAYFANCTLHQHRSWTGYCIDQIHFQRCGSGLRATHAEVNRNPEQYTETDDERDIRRIEVMVRELGRGAWASAKQNSLEAAVAPATQPNYLGSPQVIARLFEPYFQLLMATWRGEANYADQLSASQQIARVLCEDNTGYARLPGWHNETGLGRNIVQYLGLDGDYCEGENLAMLVSEGLASVALAFNTLRAQWAKARQIGQALDPSVQLKTLGQFVVTVFLGTNEVYFPGKVLEDVACLKSSTFYVEDFRDTAAAMAGGFNEPQNQSARAEPFGFDASLHEMQEIIGPKRKAPFKFAKLGIAPGAVLAFKLNPLITCSVAEKNKVIFQNQTVSLSKAAMLALEGCGRKVKAARGPDYWLCDGQSLTKIYNATMGEKLHDA